MVSVSGCWSTATCAPLAGDIGWGALMTTPAIGPAIAGLNGLELLACSHAARRTMAATAADRRGRRDIEVTPLGQLGRLHGHPPKGYRPKLSSGIAPPRAPVRKNARRTEVLRAFGGRRTEPTCDA